MKNKSIEMFLKFSLMLIVLLLSGCALIKDTPRTIIGYSFRDLESRREGALYQTYEGSLVDCYHAILMIAKEQKYTIYYQNLEKALVVLMDVPGAVNTTEVGLFLEVLENGRVKVEIASRSSFAKKTVANAFFDQIHKYL